MQSLTSENAESFAKRLFEEKMHGLEKRFIIKHSQGVFETSVKLAEGKKVDLEKLKIACWLHDIGRTIAIEDHAKLSVEVAEKEFGSLDETIKDGILNHGNSKKPQTEEGKIIQFADKISILNDYEIIKMAFEKPEYKERSIDFMKKVCGDFLKMLERYEW